MNIIDIKDMPGYNPDIKNGINSVSKGEVFLKKYNNNLYPNCKRHGAMLKVDKFGLWRCGELSCDNGCYQTEH